MKREELLKQIQNNTNLRNLVKKTNFLDSDIWTYRFWFENYLEDSKTCMECKGLKYCPKQIKYQELILTSENNKIYRHLQDCKYLRKQNRRLPSEFIAVNCNEYLINKLKNIEQDDDLYTFANGNKIKKEILTSLSKNDGFKNIWYFNKNMFSCAHILLMYAEYCASKGKTVVYIKDNWLTDQWLFSNVNKMYSCDFLFFEGFLGASSLQMFQMIDRLKFLYPILERRFFNQKNTIFSNSFKIEHFATFKKNIFQKIENKAKTKNQNQEKENIMINFFTMLQNTVHEWALFFK